MSVFRLGNELVSYLWQIDDGTKPFILGRAGVTYADKNYLVELTGKSAEYSYQYVISGEGILWIDGKEYPLKKGDIFLLPVGKPHKYIANPQNPLEKIFFCFQGNLAKKILSEYRVDNIIKIEGLDLYEEFREMFNISCRRKKGINYINNEGILQLIKIVQKISDHELVFVKGRGEVYKLKGYIEANLQRNLTLQDMADFICLSRSEFLLMNILWIPK